MMQPAAITLVQAGKKPRHQTGGRKPGMINASKQSVIAKSILNSDHYYSGIFQQSVQPGEEARDRKSTRLNSSHLVISYAVFCLKKKKKTQIKSDQTRYAKCIY